MRTSIARLVTLAACFVVIEHAAAQDLAPDTLAEHAVRIQVARSAGLCESAADELHDAVAKAWALTRPAIREALARRVAALRASLDECLADSTARPTPRGSLTLLTEPLTTSGPGSFAAAPLLATIRIRRAALLACYEHALRDDASLAGTIVVSLTIRESGRVTDVSLVDDTIGRGRVADCVAGVVAGLRFGSGPLGGPVTYSVPLVFEPIDGASGNPRAR